MEKLLLISDVLAMIEANLTEDLKTEDIAEKMYCSKSSIEKLFKIVTNMSIKNYSLRRRMSLAAKEMVAHPEMTLLDVSVKYGYSSNEAFCRAFRSVWQVNPSEYRKNPVRFVLFPAIKLENELMEDKSMSNKKKLDISELYDCIKARNNCYVVGVDIKNLVPINDISYEAGDLAIITALRRLEGAAGEEDIVFRIGGDEFVLISNSEDPEYAAKIVNEVLAQNGKPIAYKDTEIPLSLYATSYKLDFRNLRYAELYSMMHKKVEEFKCTLD